MYTFFVVLHVFVSVFLILVVLLQTGKGADMGAAFGGSSSTLFGARGQTTFIHKLTAGMALVFMVLSVTLATLSSRGASDLDEEDKLPPPGKEAGMVSADDEAGMGEDEAAGEEGMDEEPADEPEEESEAAAEDQPAP